jgi:hypothetical protein
MRGLLLVDIFHRTASAEFIMLRQVRDTITDRHGSLGRNIDWHG